MKNYIITTILWMILLLVSACSEDFLEIKPEQNVDIGDAVVDINTLQTAINGIYSELQDDAYYGRSVYVIPELMADNLYLSLRNTGRYLNYNDFIVRDQDSYAEGLWNRAYAVVTNANRAIDGGELLDLIGDQGERANQLLGEAYALRALAHFDLVRFFAQPYSFTADASHAGIPIVNSVHSSAISPNRNTVAEVYDQIISDLEKSLELMNEATGNGYFSLGAARSLLSRVYLYAGRFDSAISEATAVINGKYSLIEHDNYAALWSEDFNSETIFEIVNTLSDNAGTNGLGHFFDLAGYADALVTTDLYTLYSPEDVRRNIAIEQGVKPNAEEDALLVKKFPRGAVHDDNVKILRLAEIYLIRAEAEARKANPNFEAAQADLNTVIQRANPGSPEVTLTGTELIDRILMERRLELAFEGHRLFDLNRMGSDVTIIQGDGEIEASYPNDRFILPIPLAELNANPNAGPQNPGY